MYKYITVAADQLSKGHSEGFLGLGDHRRIIGEQLSEGFEYVGWVPVTFGIKGSINEIDLIFKRVK